MNIRAYVKKIRMKGKRCFTIQDVVNEYGVSRGLVRVLVHGLLKSGDLISPVRGLYVIIPPESQPYGSIPAKELVPLIVSHINAEYYVALLSAGLFYGATHQKPAKFQVISNKRIKRDLIFGDVEIKFIYKKSIAKLPTNDFVVDTGYLKVASPELIAIDMLHYPSHSGGLNHIATVFSELVEAIDPHKLIELAEQMNSGYQLQRIGYIIEQVDVMDENKKAKILDTLECYLKDKMKYCIPIASEIGETGYPRCRKWKIIVNTDIESDL